MRRGCHGWVSSLAFAAAGAIHQVLGLCCAEQSRSYLTVLSRGLPRRIKPGRMWVKLLRLFLAKFLKSRIAARQGRTLDRAGAAQE